jgi:hypothetical protein
VSTPPELQRVRCLLACAHWKIVAKNLAYTGVGSITTCEVCEVGRTVIRIEPINEGDLFG